MCSEALLGQETTLRQCRENEAAQFVHLCEVPSAGSEVRHRVTCCTTTGCLGASWTPFLHFEAPEVI